MNKIKINAGEWVIVCDGRKALIFENIGDAQYPNLHTREIREHSESRTSEQGSDRPGKTHSSIGTARSAMEQTDWHDRSERAFLTALGSRLDVALTKGETKSLMMIASPRALGMIRAVYSSAVRKAIRVKLGKDLVKVPVHEIEKQLFSSKPELGVASH
jgi:protein required for attachment to host cells